MLIRTSARALLAGAALLLATAPSAAHASLRYEPRPLQPPTGTHYAYSQAADDSYKRLSTTVDLTDHTSAALSLQAAYDVEDGWDYVFVEAHTVGQDDWTTLPDLDGYLSDDLSGDRSCPEIPILDEHPFLAHYLTFHPESGEAAASCTSGGTTGAFYAATGNSGGFVPLTFDLSAYAGKQVEVSITYVSDTGFQAQGAFVDDTTITADGQTLATTSFEDGLDFWATPGAPAGSAGNANDWISTTAVG